jgi:hypothetical protein
MNLKKALMSSIPCASLVFTCSLIFAAHPSAGATENVNAHGINISFLKQNPWRKQKLAVDLDSIQSREEMKIIEAALNDIIQFVAMVSNDPPSGRAVPLALTSSGRTNLRRPPIDTARSMPQRFSHIREYDWNVRGAREIAVTVDFGIVPGRPVYTDRFVFIKEDGSWKFDRHVWPIPHRANE